ncbi:nucleoid-associated protein [Rhizobium laguerreae]|uniref:nucleoid-associated protein n=1 Tax=Rhizobium laguerreae TaxID=1076926 RepID=UPI001C92500B|nr:nucleoid-associated protein [Rhizobium laguerreae]MBY3154333.1 nucleoid-associated protein [Rhizobium laguerreae]
MGFFTEQELLSLQIDNMILHVVSDQDFEIQHSRPVEHAGFFLDRIRDTDTSPLFEFNHNSPTKQVLERVATGVESFETGTQALSREFARLHGKTSKGGAFFVFELSSDQLLTRYYSLIKYDYQQAVEQERGDGGDLLRLILQAFVAQKKAVQKSALIRVVDGVAEAAISATDRLSPGSDIADYFAKFLYVKRTQSDEELTRKVRDVLRETLNEIRDHLPDRSVARAFNRAQAALRDRPLIDEDAIFEVVIGAADAIGNERLASEVSTRVARKLRSAKLDGIAFPPDRQVLRLPPIRKVSTTEGVVIQYPDDADRGIVDRRTLPEGGEIITIRTAHVTEDKVVREGSRPTNR